MGAFGFFEARQMLGVQPSLGLNVTLLLTTAG